jgi:thioredoxin reductase (NADPH)
VNKFNKTYLVVFMGLTFVIGCSSWGGRKEFIINIESISKIKNVVPVVIIGSGPAGLAAGVYTARAGLHTVVIEGSKPGGLLTETTYVENWPAESKIMGPDLMHKFKKQNKHLGVKFLTDVVNKVDFSKWPYKIETADGIKINALSVIIATGASPRVLGVPGESSYWSKGVSACAVCDAPFFKNKNVVVIGGGDSAAEQVLQLAPHVKSVTLLVRKDKMRASVAMQQKMRAISNAKVLYNHQIKKVNGNEVEVTNLELLDNKNNTSYVMPIDGVFLAIGHDPVSKLFKGQLVMDTVGYLTLQGRSQKTSVQGVFAAGEIGDHTYRQAGVAAGEGIKAGLDAISFLQNIGFNSDIAHNIQAQYFKSVKRSRSVVKKIKTIEEFEDQVICGDKPAVLDFYTDYCSSCMHMLPFYESVAYQMQDQMNFFKISADEADELVRKLKIKRVPCFLIYKNGQLGARTQEVMTKSEMLELFGKYTG